MWTQENCYDYKVEDEHNLQQKKILTLDGFERKENFFKPQTKKQKKSRQAL